ncbi:MAG: hypothetical protein JJK56_27170 [Pseudomonas sp.]|uniref:hypothetical protein n=1 Tax=unclassified Pseudomonas TaxID=196821 RepID=UPI00190AADBA|nr:MULTISPECIES: hypothetical protein [unclassified Pseudomonas]MBK3437452.1 hypothetical protein [Pseudomonas sp. MF7448]MBL7231660.1 hypothetical protein [Pseudomonas sp.]
MSSQHDLAVGMLEGYIARVIDPECSAVAVKASANTAILIFRTLGVISIAEDLYYTERLHRIYDRRQGREA